MPKRDDDEVKKAVRVHLAAEAKHVARCIFSDRSRRRWVTSMPHGKCTSGLTSTRGRSGCFRPRSIGSHPAATVIV
jgi:hypothetical protein